MADKTALKDSPAREETLAVQDPGLRKVELDLDDAPFLKEKEEEPQPPAVAETGKEPAPAEAAPPPPSKKKKLLLLGGAALGLLLLGGAAAWWFFLRTPPPPPPAEIKPEVIVVPSQPAAPSQPQEHVKDLAPFVIPRETPEGTRFLVCKFSAIGKSPHMSREIDQKLISLRDALYYYLDSKDNAYLLNSANVAAIKKDLVGILNDYLTQGHIDDILFESYLNE